jgi:hypothetical protein
MRRIGSHLLGVEQGELLLFSDFEDDGPMWKGQGHREIRHLVSFGEDFVEPPSVRVWLTMWDIAHGATARINIFADNVACDHFSIVFQTWGDTRIARAGGAWLALGPLRDHDAWEVD